MLSILESLDALRYLLILLQLNGVNSLLIPNTAVPLSHTNKLGSGLSKELGGEVPDISEPLNHEALILDPRTDPQSLTDVVIVEDSLGDVVHTQPSSLRPPSNTRLVQGLASHTPSRIDVGMPVEVLIGVLHPAHLSLARTDIGAWDVHGSPNAVLFGEVDGVLPGELLDLVQGVFFGVDLNAALG